MDRGYRNRFREVLALVQPRRLDFGVELLLGRARERAQRDGVSMAQAFALLYEFTRARVARRLEVTGSCSLVSPPWLRFPGVPPRFACDLSLGGLLRWLRAAGYRARAAGVAAPPFALGEAEVMLTTDSARGSSEPSGSGLWVPGGLSPVLQLGLVLREFGLPLRAPHCMACGGALESVPKAHVEGRIPPRTAVWKDEYFVCTGCGGLFWKGTHWEKIERLLGEAAGSSPRSAELG
jgi:uncharacterized protein with PIN domain